MEKTLNEKLCLRAQERAAERESSWLAAWDKTDKILETLAPYFLVLAGGYLTGLVAVIVIAMAAIF